MRQYIVTIDGSEEFNYASMVHATLANGLPLSLYVNKVERFDHDSIAPLRIIPAIRRIRTLLATSLKDSKFLTDTAKALGSAQWGDVVITYNHTDDTFTVADNRP